MPKAELFFNPKQLTHVRMTCNSCSTQLIFLLSVERNTSPAECPGCSKKFDEPFRNLVIGVFALMQQVRASDAEISLRLQIEDPLETLRSAMRGPSL